MLDIAYCIISGGFVFCLGTAAHQHMITHSIRSDDYSQQLVQSFCHYSILLRYLARVHVYFTCIEYMLHTHVFVEVHLLLKQCNKLNVFSNPYCLVVMAIAQIFSSPRVKLYMPSNHEDAYRTFDTTIFEMTTFLKCTLQ